MTERVTDVILSNGAAVHVFGTSEELRTKFEAALAAKTVFLNVEIEGFGKEKRVPATLNIFQVAMIMMDHDAKSHDGATIDLPDLSHASL
jgi:predicted alpha/beta-hydrolase family hydrolase